MNKEEYLNKMEMYLKKYLSKEEVEDILMDYGEYFEDGRRQNKTDIEISAKLGPPEVIAQQFTEEIKSSKKNKASDEIEKIKEKTVSNIKLAKEKISLAKEKFPSHKISNRPQIPAFLSSILDFIKNFLIFCIKILVGICVLFVACIIAFIFLMVLAIEGFVSIILMFSGLMGIIFSAISFNFISIFITIGGLLGSIAIFCIGLILAILFLCIIEKCIKFTISIFKKIFKKIPVKGVSSNA